jgi:hypothetical protein
VNRFFWAPASERPFALMRLALGLILLAQAFAVAPLTLELWSSAGAMQTSLGDYLTGGDVLWFTGLRGLIARLGVPEALWLRFLFASYVGSVVALLAVPRRASALAACALHALLMAGGSLSSYGVDQFSQVALFALVLCPGAWSPGGWSPGAWSPGRTSPATGRARFGLRVLQGTLCLAYLGSGLAKARGTDWWTGDAIYRALTMPLYHTVDTRFLVEHVWVAKLASWGTLALEIGYPALMLWPRTRRLGVIGIVAMHAGIGLFMRLHSFALTMALLTFCAFGLSAEPAAQCESCFVPSTGVE